jgi:hypothetical protein
LIWIRYPLAGRVGAAGLGTIPRLDYVGFEADGARPAVQLEKETAGVAEHKAIFISAPKRGGARGAVLANRLQTGQQPTMGGQGWRGGPGFIIDRGIDKALRGRTWIGDVPAGHQAPRWQLG